MTLTHRIAQRIPQHLARLPLSQRRTVPSNHRRAPRRRRLAYKAVPHSLLFASIYFGPPHEADARPAVRSNDDVASKLQKEEAIEDDGEKCREPGVHISRRQPFGYKALIDPAPKGRRCIEVHTIRAMDSPADNNEKYLVKTNELSI